MKGEDDRQNTTNVVETARSQAGAVPSTRVSLVLYHRDGAKVVPLVQGTPVVVGREWPADSVVADPSLSRQHARFTLADDGVWVEDLGSTNGTKLGGEPVSRALVVPGAEVALGSVAASLHVLAPKDGGLRGVDGHDRLLTRLEDEVLRARTFGRPLALVMVRSLEGAPVRHWIDRVQKLLRPVDASGFYGPTSAIVLLPEMDQAAATEIARALAGAPGLALAAGVATFPRSATSADELVDVARTAARSATSGQPVLDAAPRDTLVPPAAAEGPIVRSPAMRALYDTLERVARSTIPVLVHGETGTGKEVVATTIHAAGPRCAGPLRCINCGAIPATLVESVLFGHERGAFTGADRMQKGIFEEARGGTVFLDEIGELSAAAQVALLRVIETKRLMRVGSTHEIEVDVRVLAATHRDLEAMCSAGTFRWDLLYRLNTMTLDVPPLRERTEEIAPLADRFLAEAVRVSQGTARSISPEALALLVRYHWPGNVRELRNVIDRAVVIATGEVIGPLDLSDRVRGLGAAPEPSPAGAPTDDGGGADFKDRIRTYETELILDALRRTGGNQKEAANLLRMPIRTLAHKLLAYGIKKKFA
ncbi:MAG: sigma 54-interacting transcriptional regulator [Deltaproteobacteria bacterium]|nr:sigma 54-interacting transcriptional regulator [Deltaproteobacteria bacterium]